MTETIWFNYIIMPLLIILSRVVDQSIGTLRILFFTKGLKSIAPILGFFEVFLWFLIANQILTKYPHLDSIESFLVYFAYALGFALGTYMGIVLDNRLSIGKSIIRVILSVNNSDLETTLRNKGFGVTTATARGKDGKVKILFIAINRTELQTVIDIIKSISPSAFYTIESIQTVSAGYFSKYDNYSITKRLTRF